jgi:hypothetical protein
MLIAGLLRLSLRRRSQSSHADKYDHGRDGGNDQPASMFFAHLDSP